MLEECESPIRKSKVGMALTIEAWVGYGYRASCGLCYGHWHEEGCGYGYYYYIVLLLL